MLSRGLITATAPHATWPRRSVCRTTGYTRQGNYRKTVVKLGLSKTVMMRRKRSMEEEEEAEDGQLGLFFESSTLREMSSSGADAGDSLPT